MPTFCLDINVHNEPDRIVLCSMLHEHKKHGKYPPLTSAERGVIENGDKVLRVYTDDAHALHRYITVYFNEFFKGYSDDFDFTVHDTKLDASEGTRYLREDPQETCENPFDL